MGLFQGLPDEIPVADTDFIFAAISEEMGLILSLCLILVCVSCYVMIFKHCSGTPQSVLQTGSTGTWNLLYFPGNF